mgnify:CR=1 FL=1
MPRGRPHLNVPVFSQRLIDIAEICALSLWRGTDYESGEKMETSDEAFLAEYALGFEAKRKSPNSPFVIDEVALRRMIRVGKLKAMFRSTNPIDFANGLKTIEAVIQKYDAFRKRRIPKTPSEFALEIALDLGGSFVTWTRVPTINGNYRIPLASRILSFGFPLLPIFNFSNGLASKMRFQSRPQAALPSYFRTLEIGLLRNAACLGALKPPHMPIGMSQQTWRNILARKWWQRRVLDIALLLHFKVTKVAPNILRDAGRRRRQSLKAAAAKK